MEQPLSADAQAIANLEALHPLRADTLQAVIDALHLPAGRHGLDIGCGIGHQALQLAAAVQPGGTVTGVDISPALLNCARRLANRSPHGGQVRFELGDMYRLPVAEAACDWVWSADCVGYPAGDWAALLGEIRRVLRPGGSLALLAWTVQALLPGYTLLEARLNAACSPYAEFLADQPPEAHFLRALDWFPRAGIGSPACRTFIGQVQAPLAPNLRQALGTLFAMLWGQAPARAAPEDAAAYDRLCRTDSPNFIGDIPGYVGFFTYTLFTGKKM